jgi:Reverse transcriptase (RNA-dependent DNA polymerase)
MGLVSQYFWTGRVHEAIKSSWDTFLTNARGAEVFRAYGYSKQRQLGKLPSLLTAEGQPATSFAEKCNVFYKGLFPEPPEAEPIDWNESRPSMHYQWPKIKRLEVKYAIYKSSAKKTPGPDRLSFRVLREAYATVPELFDYLYPVLMTNGYRVISLLNCLAKVMEKIVARRLAVMAEFKTLLHMHQIGGRRQKSAIDAVMVLIQKVQANWRTRKRGSITSVLALDVKNAYPTVRAAPFAKICIQLKLPTELIKWFISIMSDRTIRFAFDGEISAMIGVNDGIPQGSPVSPIMFLRGFETNEPDCNP